MLLLPSDPISVMTVSAGGFAAAVIDLRTRTVPNALTISLALAGLALAASGLGAVRLPMAAAGSLVGFLFMMPGYMFGATGAGDVKLFAAMGTLLGPWAIAVAFLYTAIAGGFIALFVAAARSSFTSTVRRATMLVASGGSNASEIEQPAQNNRFAYAPAIAIGVIVAVLR
jgi:prepilin peptidase CpaA